MKKPFYTEYGYLVKDMETGEIDTETHYPKTLSYTKLPQAQLIDGFEWVKVAITYTEA